MYCKGLYNTTKGAVDITDNELITQIQSGDSSAMDLLIDRYYREIHRFICWKTMNADLADDLTQEVFLRLLRGVHTYKPTGKFRNYLLTIAINVCNNAFKSNKRSSLPLSENEQSPDPCLESDGKSALHAAIEGLNEKQREVVVLHIVGSFHFNEIAKICGESLSAVKSRWQQSIKKLKASLNEEDFR